VGWQHKNPTEVHELDDFTLGLLDLSNKWIAGICLTHNLVRTMVVFNATLKNTKMYFNYIVTVSFIGG